MLFALIFFWTPPHFWALAIKYVDDYRAAGVPMLPAVETPRNTATKMGDYTALTVVAGWAFGPIAGLGWVYGITSVIAGGFFLVHNVKLLHDPSAERAMKVFAYSITYLTLVFAAMAVDILVYNGF